MVVVSMIPLIDSFDPHLLLVFTFIIVLLPLAAFGIMEIFIYRKLIKKITMYCKLPRPDSNDDSNEMCMTEFVDSVVDDSRRMNATISEM